MKYEQADTIADMMTPFLRGSYRAIPVELDDGTFAVRVGWGWVSGSGTIVHSVAEAVEAIKEHMAP